MHPSRSCAAKLAHALSPVSLLVGFAAAWPAAAADRDDPFRLNPLELKRGSTGATEWLVEVEIDGDRTDTLVACRVTPEGLLLAAEDARRIGVSGITIPGGVLLRAGAPGWRLDRANGVLIVTTADRVQQIDLSAPAQPQATGRARAVVAVIADYDLNLIADRDGVRPAGLVAGRLARGPSALDTGWAITAGPGGGTRLARLDTSFSTFWPDRTLGIRIGDFISRPGPATRALRLAGVQFGTRFNVAPDLITRPVAELSGSVAVASTLDLLLNDRRVRRDQVSGNYALSRVPLVPGRNRIDVALTDVTGRQVIQTQRVYSLSDALAAGRTDFSIEAGLIRRGYGFRNPRYRGAAANMVVRHGLSDRITGEINAQLAGDFASIGGVGHLTIGGLGALSLGTQASRSARGGRTQSGAAFSAAFESIGPVVSGRIAARHTSGDYADLARSAGDPRPEAFVVGTVDFDLGRLGAIDLQVAERSGPGIRRLDDAPPRNSRGVSIGYRQTLARRMSLYVRADGRRDAGWRFSAMAGLSAAFGPRTTVSASVLAAQGGTLATAGVYQGDTAPGEWGYAVQAVTGGVDAAEVAVARRWHGVRGEAGLRLVEGTAQGRVNARGTVVFADGSAFATASSHGGIAILRTGSPTAVRVMHEGRPAGEASARRPAMIANVPAFVRSRFEIDPVSIPPDAVVRQAGVVASVPDRGVIAVDLAVERYVAARLVLRDADGNPIPPGTALYAFPSGARYRVGFDGELEINAALADAELRVRYGPSTCFVALDGRANPVADTPAVRTCHPRIADTRGSGPR